MKNKCNRVISKLSAWRVASEFKMVYREWKEYFDRKRIEAEILRKTKALLVRSRFRKIIRKVINSNTKAKFKYQIEQQTLSEKKKEKLKKMLNENKRVRENRDKKIEQSRKPDKKHENNLALGNSNSFITVDGSDDNITLSVSIRRINNVIEPFDSIGELDIHGNLMDILIDRDRHTKVKTVETSHPFNVKPIGEYVNLKVWNIKCPLLKARDMIRFPITRVVWDDSSWKPGEKKIRDKLAIITTIVFEGYMRPIWVECDVDNVKYIFTSKNVNQNVDMLSVVKSIYHSWIKHKEKITTRWFNYCSKFGDTRSADGILNKCGDLIYLT